MSLDTVLHSAAACTRRPFVRRLQSALVLAAIVLAGSSASVSDDSLRPIGKLPDFDAPDPSRWINSEPLEIEDLGGKVILVEFWTFGCGNCVRSIPWIGSLEERYGSRGLTVVGVHTPEFEYEKARDAVVDFVTRHDVSHPVLLDAEMRYWRALGNRYWPAFYLVDRSGDIRAIHIGETHVGTDRAAAFEAKIEALLSEPPPSREAPSGER